MDDKFAPFGDNVPDSVKELLGYYIAFCYGEMLPRIMQGKMTSEEAFNIIKDRLTNPKTKEAEMERMIQYGKMMLDLSDKGEAMAIPYRDITKE